MQKATKPPIHVSLPSVKLWKHPTTPFLTFLPRENSTVRSGIDHKNKNIIQGMRNVPPPFCDMTRGNRQMLPVPTDIPTRAIIRPNLVRKDSFMRGIVTKIFLV